MSEQFEIGFDTETGGIYPAVNPLLSMALVPSWDAPVTTIYVLPEEGKIIEPDAAKLNGYTPEVWAERGAVPLNRAMLMFAASLQQLLAEKKEARLVAHNAGFDRSFVEENARPFQIELPGRYQWECSMHELGSLINDGLIPRGGRSLARLGELAGLWPVGGRPELHDVTEDARAALQGYRWLRNQRRAPRPLESYHEDYGNVLWWKFPICEPPYCGQPIDEDWPGYHTHWTPIIYPLDPVEKKEDAP